MTPSSSRFHWWFPSRYGNYKFRTHSPAMLRHRHQNYGFCFLGKMCGFPKCMAIRCTNSAVGKNGHAYLFDRKVRTGSKFPCFLQMPFTLGLISNSFSVRLARRINCKANRLFFLKFLLLHFDSAAPNLRWELRGDKTQVDIFAMTPKDTVS